jgi:hypothetical protein
MNTQKLFVPSLFGFLLVSSCSHEESAYVIKMVFMQFILLPLQNTLHLLQTCAINNSKVEIHENK